MSKEFSGDRIDIARTLEFNTATVALAGVGFGYVGTLAEDGLSSISKVLASLALIALAASFVLGLLVAGRATKLDETDTDDAELKKNGLWHSVSLVLGLVFAGLLLFAKVWKGDL